MRKKVIAIGNRMMGDDGIGIEVAEHMREFFEKSGFEIIIGETDIEYCLSFIRLEDFIIILDAAYSGLETGTLSIMSIREAAKGNRKCSSQHEPNLLQWLDIYGIEVKGFVIGIEVHIIEPNWGLSETMENTLSLVCDNVKDIIRFILEEGYDA